MYKTRAQIQRHQHIAFEQVKRTSKTGEEKRRKIKNSLEKKKKRHKTDEMKKKRILHFVQRIDSRSSMLFYFFSSFHRILFFYFNTEILFGFTFRCDLFHFLVYM